MNEDKTFEQAFERLDEILQKMNEGKVSLDTSLNLFEEADSLISNCHGKLTKAEKKIEILIKNRNQQLEMENEKPKTENFELSSKKIMEE